jgi:xanthine dehydrogenase YagS FAD-binding subunit
MLPSFSYVRAQSLDDAIRQLSVGDARVHAGGSDLLGCLRDGVFETPKVVSLSGLTELRGIHEASNGSVRIGALTKIAEVARSPVIRQRHTVLAEAASAVASPQMRNQATLGGNLCQKPRCWYYRGEFNCLRKGGGRCYAAAGENHFHCILGGGPCYMVNPSDTAPALVALDAAVRIVGPDGTRTVLVEEFHVPAGRDFRRETVLEPDEIVTEILLPQPSPAVYSSYYKVRGRGSWDFAVAGVALALAFRDSLVHSARVVLSGAAPVPWRCRDAEEVLTGERLDGTVAARAAQVAMADARALRHNGYKIPLFRGLIEEQLLALVAD